MILKSMILCIVGTVLFLGCTTQKSNGNIDDKLVHHVFVWLKNPDSMEDLKKLVEGMRTLNEIEVIRSIQIGQPAATEKRDVVDYSYDASLLLIFDNVEDQKAYQVHPVHLAFVTDHKDLWSKVVVYDTEQVTE